MIQDGLDAITEALKIGGVTYMMDRLSNPAKIKAFELTEQLKDLLGPLFGKHQDDIISGEFSKTTMEDWANGDANFLELKQYVCDNRQVVIWSLSPCLLERTRNQINFNSICLLYRWKYL